MSASSSTEHGRSRLRGKTLAPLDMLVFTYSLNPFAGLAYQGGSSNGVLASEGKISSSGGIWTDAWGNVYFSDTLAHTIIRVDKDSNMMSVVAGLAGNYGWNGDGSTSSQTLFSPTGMTGKKSEGKVIFCDTNNHVIRELDLLSSELTTIVGHGSKKGQSGEDVPATSVLLSSPLSVFLDQTGNLFIAELDRCTIRKVTVATHLISTIAGVAGTCGFSTGGPATSQLLNGPRSVFMDFTGSLWIVDGGNRLIRRLTSDGNMSIVSNGVNDDQTTTVSSFDPLSLWVDKALNVFVSDGKGLVNAVNVFDGSVSLYVSLNSSEVGPGLWQPSLYPLWGEQGENNLLFVADSSSNRIMSIILPTSAPSSVPSSHPSSLPTSHPTAMPTSRPTSVPTASPTSEPTSNPTSVPTSVPTSIPTSKPTSKPSGVPTGHPTPHPTNAPTETPSYVPTTTPTASPTASPTFVPTEIPTANPTLNPSPLPTMNPTVVPTRPPTFVPTAVPSANPSAVPTTTRTNAPTTIAPSISPTQKPSTALPTTKSPTIMPTLANGQLIYYNFANHSGTSIIDVWSKMNAVASNAGVLSQAAKLTSNGYHSTWSAKFVGNQNINNVNIPTITIPNLSAGLSFSFWINKTADGGPFWLLWGGNTNLAIQQRVGYICVGGYTALYSNVPLDRNWHHIAFSFSSTNRANLWVDNVLLTRVTNYNMGSGYPTINTISNAYFGSSLIGYVAEFRVYNTLFDNSMVNALYTNTI